MMVHLFFTFNKLSYLNIALNKKKFHFLELSAKYLDHLRQNNINIKNTIYNLDTLKTISFNWLSFNAHETFEYCL